MTLKVIGAGLGRTGTRSTQLALNQLGFPCYHMSEVISNKDNKSAPRLLAQSRQLAAWNPAGLGIGLRQLHGDRRLSGL